MTPASSARHGFAAAIGFLLFTWFLAACAPRVDGPAPVVSSGAVEQGPVSVTVRRGQSLSEIAQTYHVPMRVIAEANHLSPPYRIQTGRTLIIPGAGQPRPRAPVAVAALPASPPEDAPPPPRDGRPATTSSDQPSVVATPVPPPAAAAPAGQPSPAGASPVQLPSAPARPPRPAAPEPSAAPPSGRSSGAFLWPVRGQLLASYGSRADGTHNDGINIAAPRGAAVQAADAGIVAYTGNELRGYGNLILIKHPNGWISAYAHCDLMLVKRGQKVARGQVIARVGSTGNVSDPQLHFELRRGNHPVDPREFLAPLPTAASKGSRAG